MHYRKDIDGLRAIAVLLVVVFHVYPHKVTGGFIGVDVFFVISGFLITRLIDAELRDGDFSLLDFYARRIRRIFPALALVLAACLAAGWFVLFPADYRNLGKHVAASAGFIANFSLWRDAGYFDDPSELKPVLHLWSLGIEEQFYILWPTLLLIAWRWRRLPAALAAAVLAASFACNLIVSRGDSTAAFFLPTTRFWELMVGCLLALGLPHDTFAPLASRHGKGCAVLLCDGLSLAGSILIIAGAVFINSGRSFPGWWALLPTLGAAALIAAGPGALVNRTMLSRQPAVQLGLISYPLYLWHWPILAFLRHYHFKEPPDLMRWAGILVALALAAITYRFVERPIRRGAPFTWKPAGAALAMILIGSAGLTAVAERGFAGRFPPEIAVLLDDADNVAKVFVGSGLCRRPGASSGFALTTDCALPPGSPLRQVVVWGDSHSANLVGGLLAREERAGIHVVFFTTVGCPPIPSYAYTHPGLPNCPAANRLAIDAIPRLKPDTVILAGNWGPYDGGPNAALVDERSIRGAVTRVAVMGPRRVVGVGQFPLWDYAVPKLLAREYRNGHAASVAAAAASALRSNDYVAPLTFVSDQRVARWFRAAGAEFVSPLATLCDARGCLITVPGRIDPMERDEDHMTNAGSIWFVRVNEKALIGGASP